MVGENHVSLTALFLASAVLTHSSSSLTVLPVSTVLAHMVSKRGRSHSPAGSVVVMVGKNPVSDWFFSFVSLTNPVHL